MSRKDELEKLIKHNNELYWNGKELEISDIEYDKLIRELESIDPNNELITNFGRPDNNAKLVTHKHKMLSLGKIYSFEELNKWITKVSRSNQEEFVIQPKYDGMSGKLENGFLSSRGDGLHGQDYTDKLQIIKFDSKNKNINIEKDFLLGEIIIKNSDFNTIFKNVKSKAGIPFKNQRNGIAGIMGTDDIEFYINQGAKITFVDYNVNSWYITKNELTEERWNEVVNIIKNNVDYPIDGIVIKLNDNEYFKSLGETTHHPRGAIAFKFTNESHKSILRDIIWGMGKQQISAVGVVDPVDFNGVTVKQVKLQLTKPKSSSVETCLIDGSLQIGDEVEIERAGDIVPHVTHSYPGKNRKRVILEYCPFCGGSIIKTDTKILCMNENCTENIIQNLYASTITLGFKNIGEAYIKNLVKVLHVKTLEDLFNIKVSNLSDKCFGSKLKLIFDSELAKAKYNCNLATLLAALNIPNLGKKVGELLSDNFSIQELFELTDIWKTKTNFQNPLWNKFLNIKGIGDVIQRDILEGLYELKDMIKRIIPMLPNLEIKNETSSSGLTICFTGKMEHKRSEMEELAKNNGYVPVDAVNKDLNILVCADPNSGSSKLKKAEKLGIKIISEIDFMKGIEL